MFIFLLLVLYKILNTRVRDLGPLGRFIVALYIIHLLLFPEIPGGRLRSYLSQDEE